MPPTDLRAIFPLAAVSASLVLALTGCDQPAPAATETMRPVRTFLVETESSAVRRTFPGRVEAARQAQLAFQVPGLLVSLPVREGQAVKKGDIIAQLRPDEFSARLGALMGQLDRARADLLAARSGARPEERQRLEAELRSAEASFVNARAEYQRATRLVNSRTISRIEFERAETAYRVARENAEAARRTLEQAGVGREEDILAREAEVRGLEAQVVEAELNLADATLRAPFDGTIAQRFVEQGQNVRAQQPVVKFQDASEIEIAVDVPEAVMAADLRTSDIVALTASFSSVPGVRYPVRVQEIAQRADPVTQTFAVRAAMPAPQGVSLLPGMTATVEMDTRRAAILAEGLRVPMASLFEGEGGGQAVWVIGADSRAMRRAVKTGAVSGGFVEVIDGLQPGERIAAAGVTRLREGMPVRDLGDALGGVQP